MWIITLLPFAISFLITSESSAFAFARFSFVTWRVFIVAFKASTSFWSYSLQRGKFPRFDGIRYLRPIETLTPCLLTTASPIFFGCQIYSGVIVIAKFFPTLTLPRRAPRTDIELNSIPLPSLKLWIHPAPPSNSTSNTLRLPLYPITTFVRLTTTLPVRLCESMNFDCPWKFRARA